MSTRTTVADLESRFADFEQRFDFFLDNSPTPNADDYSDINLRVHAVKEATVRVRVIMPYETPLFVDEVLRVAAFLLGEQIAGETNIYNEHYHIDPAEVPQFNPTGIV